MTENNLLLDQGRCSGADQGLVTVRRAIKKRNAIVASRQP